MAGDDPFRPPLMLKFLVCTQTHCSGRTVQLKVHADDPADQELSGPELLQALHDLVDEKGVLGQVKQTSCMGGCRIGPRLNVLGAEGLKAAMRYLHLPRAKSHLRCARWADVGSLEALIEHHLQEEETRAASRHPR